MSSTKELLIETVEKRKNELLELVSSLIRIPSENPSGSQLEVVQFVKGYLEENGIAVQQLACNEDFPCLSAEIRGKEGYHLLFNGHVDVVPAGDLSQWDYAPFCGMITEKQILGRGTSDMKAGVAAVLFAMKLITELKIKLHGSLFMHIVSDEESGGQFGTKWLCEQGYAARMDACIVAEPTSKTIEIGQKGNLVLTMKAQGKSAHGSLGGFKGDNAILKLTRVLLKLSKLTSISGTYQDSQLHALNSSKKIAQREIGTAGVGEVIDHISVNVGMIKGGTRPNMVPDVCEAVVDIRLPIGVDQKELSRVIKRTYAEEKGVSCDFKWKGNGNYTDEYDPLVQTVRKNAEKLWGFDIVPAYQWASSDAREYRKLNIPTIQYGPSNTEGIHSYNENVDIEDVVKASQIYLMTICDLLKAE